MGFVACEVLVWFWRCQRRERQTSGKRQDRTFFLGRQRALQFVAPSLELPRARYGEARPSKPNSGPAPVRRCIELMAPVSIGPRTRAGHPARIGNPKWIRSLATMSISMASAKFIPRLLSAFRSSQAQIGPHSHRKFAIARIELVERSLSIRSDRGAACPGSTISHFETMAAPADFNIALNIRGIAN
jgi:hypothetical protein